MYDFCLFFFFKQKTAYEMRISDWSSDVCSSDLRTQLERRTDFLFEKSRDTVCAGTEIPCQSQVAQAHQLDARTLFRRGLSNLGTKCFDQRRRLRPWRLHVALQIGRAHV